MTDSPAQAVAQVSQPTYLHTRTASSTFVSVEEILLWLTIALCPFQDTFLQKIPLHLTPSFSYLPLIVLFALAILRHLFRSPFQVSRTLLVIVLYIGLVCAVHAVGADGSLNWQFALPPAILTSVAAFVVFRLDFSNQRVVRNAVLLAFLFTIAGIVSEMILGPSGIPPIQVTPAYPGRMRGFCNESSALSVQVVASGMLAAHFLRARWQKYGVGLLTCILLVLSSSKGGLICLLLCVVVLGVVRSRRSWLAKIVALIVVTPIVVVGGLYIVTRVETMIDLNQSTTFATRASMAVYALITVVHNPFGVGFTGFVPSVPVYLPAAMDFVEKLLPVPLVFSEVQDYLTPPILFVDCKTYFFDYLVYFGFPFAIAFFWFARSLSRKLLARRCYWLFLGVLFSLLALCTYYSTISAWTLPILFGISRYEVGKREAPLHLH